MQILLEIAFLTSLVLWIVPASFVAYLCFKSRSRRRFRYAIPCSALALVLFLANPIINRFVFWKVAETSVNRTWSRLNEVGYIGRSPAWLQSELGRPSSITKTEMIEEWRYKPGPWYVWQWDELVVVIIDDRIVGAWPDYF